MKSKSIVAALLVVSMISSQQTLVLATQDGNSIVEEQKNSEKELMEAAEMGVNIPDGKLKEVLNEHLMQSYDSDITKEQLESITELTFSNRQVKDLTGLEYCKNLKVINISFNSLSDLTPIGALTNLESLTLSACDLKDLSSLSGLRNLTYLNLSRNKIQNIDSLNALSKLKELIIFGNSIEDLSPLKGLKSLENLQGASNNIRDISPLSELENLTDLNLSVNKINNIEAVRNFKNLKRLDLGINYVTDISPLKDMNNLEMLGLLNQGVELAAVNAVDGKVTIKNPLVNINGEIIEPTNISNGGKYEAASNTISWENCVNFYEEFEFGQLVSVGSINTVFSGKVKQHVLYEDNSEVINVPDKNLRKIFNEYFGREEDDIITKKMLESIGRELIINNRNISSLEGIQYCTNLSYLEANNNNISDISPLASSNLRGMSLQGNSITDISPLAMIKDLWNADIGYQKIYATKINIKNGEAEGINLIKNYQGNSVTPTDITLGGVYISDSNIIKWTSLQDKALAEYKFVYYSLEEGDSEIPMFFSGTVYQEMETSTNTVPSINGANDLEILQGSNFDPLAEITAEDKEDGDLTGKIAVEGMVDTNKPGQYMITYTVIDSDGNKAEVTRTITVKENNTETKPDIKPEIKPNSSNKLPQTGNPLASMLDLLGVGALAMGTGLIKRKKNK